MFKIRFTRLVFCLVLLVNYSFGQSLNPEATRVKTVFDKLTASPKDKQLQAVYIASFSANSKSFLSVFNPISFDQLYNGSVTYIDTLYQCSFSFSKEVISKCVDIGKNLVWDADAVGYLQDISVRLASTQTKIFVAKYKSLTDGDKSSLFKFYADVENFDGYPEYQDLIDKLNALHQNEIAKKFEIARTKRKKLKDH